MDNHCCVSTLHRVSYCALQALIALSLLMVPVFAVESDSSSAADSSSSEVSGVEEVAPSDPEPSTVYVVSPDVDITGFLEAGPDAYEVLSVEPDLAPVPFAAGDDFPFYGSCWVKGTADGLGQVSLYFPINRQSGFIGLDSSGHLFNVSDSSFSGLMYDARGNSYTVSFGSFALPRYRAPNGSSWEYQTLYLTAAESNLVLPDSPAPTHSLVDLLPYVGLLLLGGVLLCSMRKS